MKLGLSSIHPDAQIISPRLDQKHAVNWNAMVGIGGGDPGCLDTIKPSNALVYCNPHHGLQWIHNSQWSYAATRNLLEHTSVKGWCSNAKMLLAFLETTIALLHYYIPVMAAACTGGSVCRTPRQCQWEHMTKKCT